MLRPVAVVASMFAVAGVTAGALYIVTPNREDEVVRDQPPSVPTQPPNPCAGLSDQDCMTLIAEARAEGERKQTQLIEEANDSGLDLRTLPQMPLQPDYFTEPHPDVATAAGEADLIVVVRSENVRLVPFITAEVTISVERVLKGTAGSEMMVVQNASLPAEVDDSGEWRIGSLGIDEHAPLLLPGDRAVLFLKSASDGGHWVRVQEYTGHYRIDSWGRVSALPSNPFAAQVNGKTLDEFIKLVAEMTSASAAR